MFEKFTSVKFIDASYLKLTSLDDFTFNVKTLLELNLRGNKLRKLQRNFNGADALQTIDLSHNEISQIDKLTFTSLNSLFELNLSNNQLTDLQGFSASKSLRFIDLSKNKLSHLVLPYDSFSNMPKLEALNLRNNKIGGL